MEHLILGDPGAVSRFEVSAGEPLETLPYQSSLSWNRLTAPGSPTEDGNTSTGECAENLINRQWMNTEGREGKGDNETNEHSPQRRMLYLIFSFVFCFCCCFHRISAFVSLFVRQTTTTSLWARILSLYLRNLWLRLSGDGRFHR